MKPVLIFPRGTLCPKDRERLSKAGYVGIEAENPKSVVLTIPGTPFVSDNDITAALMDSIAGGYQITEREKFAASLICRWRAKAKELKPVTPDPNATPAKEGT